MSDAKSTLDDEVDDEGPEDTRETCWFWDSRNAVCHFESLIPGSEPCASCPDPEVPDAEADADHAPVSIYGWNCDVCGRPVNGRTDENGVPAQQGDSVHHIEDEDEQERADNEAWIAHHGE